MCNSERDVRDKHLESILKYYYDEFTGALKKLNTPWNPVSYTYSDFRQEFEKSLEYGFLISFWLVPMILQDDDDLPEFNATDEAELQIVMDKMRTNMTSGKIERVVKRLTDLLEDAVEKGML
jgi:hypothetical protein